MVSAIIKSATVGKLVNGISTPVKGSKFISVSFAIRNI